MEYVDGLPLDEHINTISGPINEQQLIPLFLQLLDAFEYAHQNKIVHRDIKPENIMIDSDGYLVVIDLGLAGRCEGMTHGLKSFKGTYSYLAPEMFSTPRNYGKAIDWWALGTLMYELMYGRPPFYDKDYKIMYSKIVQTPLTFPPSDPLNDKTQNAENADDLIKSLLQKDPLQRLTDPVRIRNHLFFEIIKWDRLLTKDYDPPYIPRITFKGISVEEIRHAGYEAIEYDYFPEEGSPNPSTEFMRGGQRVEDPRPRRSLYLSQGGGGSISSTKKIGAPYTRERSNAIYS